MWHLRKRQGGQCTGIWDETKPRGPRVVGRVARQYIRVCLQVATLATDNALVTSDAKAEPRSAAEDESRHGEPVQVGAMRSLRRSEVVLDQALRHVAPSRIRSWGVDHRSVPDADLACVCQTVYDRPTAGLLRRSRRPTMPRCHRRLGRALGLELVGRSTS